MKEDRNIKREMRIRHFSYPVPIAVEDKGFIASFQDRLILLSPINEGVFECNGWIVRIERVCHFMYA